jgi:hypothetical protein
MAMIITVAAEVFARQAEVAVGSLRLRRMRMLKK